MILKKKLKKIVPASYYSVNRIIDRIIELKLRTSPRTMLDFEVQLVDHCNLNCKGCSHFSPIAAKRILDPTEYEKDIKRLSFLANGEAGVIRLMGGEPLLHPKIIEFLKLTRKSFKNATIDLDTNGLLALSMKDSFYEAMHDNDINLVITKYPIGLDYNKIREKCRKFDVNFEFFDNEKKSKNRLFNKLTLFTQRRGICEKNFYNCYLANCCHTLRHGKMYTCSTIPYIDIFNKKFNKKLIVSSNDYIDIYKVNSIEEILDFFSHPVPFCSYCDVNGRKYGLKWEKSNQEISEWIDLE